MEVSLKLLAGRTAVLACSLIACVSAVDQVQASSDDAWEEFRQEVKEACVNLLKDDLLVRNIQVDPYGSESYGFAIMIGIEPGTANERLVACAYDKQSKSAEVSGYFDK
ncbi:hypothetical protein [Shinella sp. HZN7]|uniref:hypothetical protein n=1 Tax=Shinella sp. (strain HZN7) TaxID=879274 RepID=UPI0007DAA92E|nr:hypothetical protein [Shinella sp. HZN7]ANH08523.1 hypothetical protein shn_30750 [Shinella sp. HZN7]